MMTLRQCHDHSERECVSVCLYGGKEGERESFRMSAQMGLSVDFCD